MDQRKIDKLIELYDHDNITLENSALLDEFKDYINGLYNKAYSNITTMLKLLSCIIIILSGQLIYTNITNSAKSLIQIVSIIMFVIVFILIIRFFRNSFVSDKYGIEVIKFYLKNINEK